MRSMMNDNEAYTRALQLWGEPAQELMAIEEMAELMDKLAKHLRGRSIGPNEMMDEIVDVQIMMRQLQIVWDRKDFGIPSLSMTVHLKKMERLKQRIEDAEREKGKQAGGHHEF